MPGGPRFVGRERELTLLDEGLTEALSGHVRTFLLVGEPGIGKTRLAEMVQGRARAQGAQVCWGRCWEEGGAPAFWPWIQVLRELLKDMDPATIAGEIGSAASHVVQLVPELAQHVAEPEPTTSPDAHFFKTVEAGVPTWRVRFPSPCATSDDVCSPARPTARRPGEQPGLLRPF